MRQEFINKVIAEVKNNWSKGYDAKEENGMIIVFFEGKEVAFIKNYKAESDTEGNEQEVEQLQHYCEIF